MFSNWIFQDKVYTTVFYLVLFFIISGCGTQSISERDYITLRLNTNPSTLDPALITDLNSATIAAKIYNGLVQINNDLDIVGDIAQDWRVSKDGKVYHFKLKKGVYFTNAVEVTARHFKDSFQRVMSPKSKSPNTWVFSKIVGAYEYRNGQADEIKGIKVIDNHTLQITLIHPFSAFLKMLTTTAAYVNLHIDGSEIPLGTGPFKVSKWRHGQDIILVRNDKYFHTPVKVQKIVYKIIPEDLTALVEFELGNLDIIGVSGSAYKRLIVGSATSKYTIIPIKSINTYYLGMNCSKTPFNDIEVRKAVFMAIDRKKILDTFMMGRGRFADSFIPSELKWWGPNTQNNIYNPVEAAKIFKIKKLKDITMYVPAEQEVVDLAEIIQSYLKKAGLEISIKQLQWSAFRYAVNNGDAEMFWLSWWADYPDVENFLYPTFHSSNFGYGGNRVRYSNKEVDLLIEKGQRAVLQNDTYNAYKKAESLIINDFAWIYFWHKNDYIAVSNRIENVISYPVYTMDKGLDFNLKMAKGR